MAGPGIPLSIGTGHSSGRRWNHAAYAASLSRRIGSRTGFGPGNHRAGLPDVEGAARDPDEPPPGHSQHTDRNRDVDLPVRTTPAATPAAGPVHAGIRTFISMIP